LLPTFYIFDTFYVGLTILISIIGCMLVVHFSKLLKTKKNSFLVRIQYALILATCFWFKNLLIALTINLSFSTSNLIIYAISSYIFVFIGAYFAIQVASIVFSKPTQFVKTSHLVAICILCADTIGFLFLFNEFLEFKIILYIMTILLVISTAMPLIRFLNQMTNEEENSLFSGWRLFGCIASGFSLAGIPYIVLVSILNLSSLENEFSNSYFFLVPFIFMINSSLLMWLVPNLFGESVLIKNKQSHFSLFNQNPDAVFSVTTDGIITDVNREATRLTGYKTKELVGLHFNMLSPVNHDPINQLFEQALTGTSKTFETHITNKKGKQLEVKITVARIILEEKVVGLYGIVKDITEQKKAEKKIRFLAYHDDLTKLPNRRLFEEKINYAVFHEEEFSLLYIDFDRFKRINDTFGHYFGDEILKCLGDKLTSSLPEDCFISRLAGDEFAILAPNTYQKERVATTIIEEFRNPIKIHGYEFTLTASIGIAQYPKNARNSNELLKRADTAMYVAKEYGANNYQVFHEGMMELSVDRIKLENDLRKAIENEELTVHFQPKYHAMSNKVIGAEALARWKHPLHGYVPPIDFIALAEETNLIVSLERLMIKKTLSYINDWKKKKLEVPRTSINISIVHFYQEDLVPFIEENLRKNNLIGDEIEIEITESIIAKGELHINEKLQKLRKLGIEISVDDFGTGYSSLSYLVNFSIDRLKIDKSFVQNFDNNKEVIAAIIAMSKNLNIKTIAEGVETKEQLESLIALDCLEVQGYIYSRPLEIQTYEEFLLKNNELTVY